MTAIEAKQRGFTHRGKIYGVPVYLTDDEDMNIEGTNWLNEQLVSFGVWLDTTLEINECFAIVKGQKL